MPAETKMTKKDGFKQAKLSGADDFRGSKSDENSYEGKSHKEVAPNVYEKAQLPRDTGMPAPIGGGKVQPQAHGFGHKASQRDGVLRNSGHPGASRLGKRSK
jgi:hypothetical protein